MWVPQGLLFWWAECPVSWEPGWGSLQVWGAELAGQTAASSQDAEGGKSYHHHHY